MSGYTVLVVGGAQMRSWAAGGLPDGHLLAQLWIAEFLINLWALASRLDQRAATTRALDRLAMYKIEVRAC